MTGDGAQGNQSQPAGQQGAASGAAGSVGAGSQPQYVTKDEAQRMATDAAENAFRRAQSLVDTTDSRIQKQVRDSMGHLEETFQAAKAAGHEIPPDIQTKMRDDAIRKALTTSPEATGGASASAAGGAQPGQAGADDGKPDPVTAKAIKLLTDMKAEVKETDPEWSLIDQETDDPELFLASVYHAGKTWLTRTSSGAQAGNVEADQASAAARMPSLSGKGGSTSPLPDGLSAIDYFSLGYNKQK